MLSSGSRMEPLLCPETPQIHGCNPPKLSEYNQNQFCAHEMERLEISQVHNIWIIHYFQGTDRDEKYDKHPTFFLLQ